MTNTPEQLTKGELIKLIEQLACEARDRFGCLTIFAWSEVDQVETIFESTETMTCHGFHYMRTPPSSDPAHEHHATLRKAATAWAAMKLITESLAGAAEVEDITMAAQLTEMALEIIQSSSHSIRIDGGGAQEEPRP